MRKPMLKVAAASLLSLSLMSTTAFASSKADNSTSSSFTITQDQIKQIKQNLSDLGVNPGTQEKLIKELKDGQMWDCMNPSMQNAGITTSSTSTVDGQMVQEYRTVFPDGSVNVCTVTTAIPNSNTTDIQPNSVSGGTVISGSGSVSYYGANVSDGNGVVTGSFLADYAFVQGGYDEISNVYNPSVKVYLGSYSNVSTAIQTKDATPGLFPAKAYLKWDYTNQAGESTQYVYLTVSGNSATSSFSPS